MITEELDFLSPTTVAAALDILAEHGDEVVILSGGMSLVPMMNLGIVKPTNLMSLNHVQNLDGLEFDGSSLHIGAMTRQKHLETNDLVAAHAPMLAEAASKVGDVQVRNRGTVGGSICHADPAADLLPVLAVSRAEVVLESSDGSRAMGIEDFLVDIMFTAREANELLTAVIVPAEPSTSASAYIRFARVEGSFAIVNAAARIDEGFTSTRIAIGGIGPKPVTVDATDIFGNGISPDGLTELAARAYEAAEFATGDIHSDAEYVRNMAGVFSRRAVELAATRL